MILVSLDLRIKEMMLLMNLPDSLPLILAPFFPSFFNSSWFSTVSGRSTFF